MDVLQVVLMLALIVLVLMLGYIGFWVASVFSELKITLTKVNLVLDDAKTITQSVSRPVASVSEFLMGFKSGLKLFNKLAEKKKNVSEG